MNARRAKTESYLSSLDRKNLARAILVAFGDDYAGGRAACRKAFKQFGHKFPRDLWAFVSDGQVSDRDIEALRVKAPENGAWIVEISV